MPTTLPSVMPLGAFALLAPRPFALSAAFPFVAAICMHVRRISLVSKLAVFGYQVGRRGTREPAGDPLLLGRCNLTISRFQPILHELDLGLCGLMYRK